MLEIFGKKKKKTEAQNLDQACEASILGFYEERRCLGAATMAASGRVRPTAVGLFNSWILTTQRHQPQE